ncbi:uncharacterized protein LOC100113915 isoform X2 [Nasonia vitripennis]|uniref:Myosin-M heavy chain n=1 Tax=Nasonia vitripennis TaxID=7425 RepID=A0A7M7T9F9_NASVI|nr:uncharacterized protein LOC100113915 isoform X2 [Nasonia vitripennis]
MRAVKSAGGEKRKSSRGRKARTYETRKGYETLSKGKKSWSVRLGLSRASQSPRQDMAQHRSPYHPGAGGGAGWGTVSGGSVLAQQMIYGEPWLYGTVRSRAAPGGHMPQLAHHHGAPVLLVCSCPDFLSGTARDLGSNCRKCGGHRLAGLAIGGTCRMPTTTVRARPSLAGMLKPTVDDPYDLMRRNRLIEPRSRARSISPQRQANQRDVRSQSVVRCNPKDRSASSGAAVKVATVEPMSRTEWFDCTEVSSPSSGPGPGSDRLLDDNSNQSTDPKDSDWTTNKSSASQDLVPLRSQPGRIVRVPNHNVKSRRWQPSSSSSSSLPQSKQQQQPDEETSSTTTTTSGDSRKSILECDVNPYLLLKNQQQRKQDEDDLSDDLSDNALEHELHHSSSSSHRSTNNLFDPSKVKSIERIPNRSSVAAIGGQRIRVFNEPREPSDEEDGQSTLQPSLTRIPIPKISPKRPPRRLKEAKNALKSILKRTDKLPLFAGEPKRKSVLFNVDNVILAPEKPTDICLSPQRKTSKTAMSPTPIDAKAVSELDAIVNEAPIVPEELQVERPRFITIPNIKSFKQPTGNNTCQQPAVTPWQDRPNTRELPEAKIVPRVKSMPPIEKIKIDKFVPSKKQQLQDQHHQQNRLNQDLNALNAQQQQPMSAEDNEIKEKRIVDEEKSVEESEKSKVVQAPTSVAPAVDIETEVEAERMEAKEETADVKPIAVDEKDMIEKCEGVSVPKISTTGTTCLTRSQSERSTARPEMSAADVNFVDTMRLSLCRRSKDEDVAAINAAGPEQGRRKMSFEEARGRVALKMIESSLMGARIEEESESKEVRDDQGSEKKSIINETSAAVIRQPSTEEEQFRRTRPTSWSPPPVEAKSSPQQQQQQQNNVFKITVTPRSAPASIMVHRLQVGSSTPLKGSRGTSIIINSDQQSPRSTTESTSDSDNKVTISVGGENTICNPTVISVNSNMLDSPPILNQTSGDEKRTLVILDNYRSNIVIGGERQDVPKPQHLSPVVLQQDVNANETLKSQSKPIEIRPRPKFKETDESPDSSPNWKQIVDAPKSSDISKEEMISKLLEDSLRKARENGEILDESSGEAILKILKQSLLKSSEPEPGYFRPSCSLNSSALDGELIATNMFLEENAYEVIKEPIYEEIPDEPPPLPLSPPPTEDYLKGRIFFGDEYRDLNSSIVTPLDGYYKPLTAHSNQYLEYSYLSKSPDEQLFKKSSTSSIADHKDNLSSKFELLNFIMDSKERTRVGNVALDQEEEVDEVEEEEEEEEDEEEDPERDLEALYEQKETSLGDLSSKSSQISNVSDSSEECNIILANSPEALKTRTVDIERTDSGVGSESSQASSGRGGGISRRWRAGNAASTGSGVAHGAVGAGVKGSAGNGAITSPGAACAPHKPSDIKHCEDCEQCIELPLIIDSGCLVYSPLVCRKCGKKRSERKEIITEIVETEQKYGRDLQIILDEFHRPMLRAGLLTQEQLSAIFLNVEELLEHNQILAEKLKDAVDIAQESGDEDLVTVDLGKIFLEAERMLHAFESYCTRQGGASLLLQNLEKEKELLRIFLKVSQMENTVLRRMNLNSFLMVPVQRVTKYPLLLARLLKATPSGRPEMQELKKRLKQAQTNIELHLEHMNAEAKDITSTKLWRRISIIQNGRRSTGEQDMVNIKLRKMAVEVLEWAHEDSRFVLEGRLLVAQPTDNNWRRGRTVKLAPVTAMLVTNGKPNKEFLDFSDDSLFPRQIGIKDATLLLVKEKLGRYSLLREPLYLDKCIVCCETDLEDYFEIQELSSKETFIFKAEDGARTKRWCRTLQAHAQSLGAWRRRRGALPNIMICGVARN